MKNEHSAALPRLDWIPVPNWTKVKFQGFADVTGLIRFREHGEIVYIGMESVSISHVRRFCTKGGSALGHGGGREIYARRSKVTLEYARYDQPESEIKRVRALLWEMHEPKYNFEEFAPAAGRRSKP